MYESSAFKSLLIFRSLLFFDGMSAKAAGRDKAVRTQSC